MQYDVRHMDEENAIKVFKSFKGSNTKPEVVFLRNGSQAEVRLEDSIDRRLDISVRIFYGGDYSDTLYCRYHTGVSNICFDGKITDEDVADEVHKLIRKGASKVAADYLPNPEKNDNSTTIHIKQDNFSDSVGQVIMLLILGWCLYQAGHLVDMLVKWLFNA